MADYFPKSFTTSSRNNNSKSRDAIAKTVMASFESQGFSGYAVPAKFIQHEIVASASSVWPTHFSAMFEAFRCDGPPLPRNDVIIAVNSGGVFLLDNVNFDVVVGFHYYDIVDAVAASTDEIRNAEVGLLAVDGAAFKFLTPNAETIARIVRAFLEGLRRRSRWAVAILPVVGVQARLNLKPGDVIELLNNDNDNTPSSSGDDVTNRPSTSSAATSSDSSPTTLFGRCERTGERGCLTHESVYILPTIEKPSPDFLTMLASLSQDNMETLPRRRPRPSGTVFIDSGAGGGESVA